MKELKRIPFMVEDNHYEVRILYDGNVINVAVFINNHPATGYRHHIQLPKNIDPRTIIKTNIFNETVELAKGDIIEKRWERLKKYFGQDRSNEDREL
jgi:hypothetical protein